MQPSELDNTARHGGKSGEPPSEPPSESSGEPLGAAVPYETHFVLRDVRSRKRGRARRWLAAISVVALAVSGLAAAGFVYLEHRLDQGPLELATVGKHVAAELSARAGRGYRVSIGRTFLAKERGRPSISVSDFALHGENGETILSAPKAIVSLDWLALATGKIRPRRLAVAGLDLRVKVEADGGLSVSAGRSRIRLTGALLPTATPGAAEQEIARRTGRCCRKPRGAVRSACRRSKASSRAYGDI